MIAHEPNTIPLTGFAREAVLKAVTTWIDPILFCNNIHFLNLRLKKEKGSLYRGNCPWCRNSRSLTMNSGTTHTACSACGESGDLLDLVKEERVSTTMDAVDYLSGLIETKRKVYREIKKKLCTSRKQLKTMGAAE